MKIWIESPLFGLFVCLAVCAPSMFFDLGSHPIFQWDEARYLGNALEILESGRFLPPHFDGKVDLWNFKPPLGTALMAASMAIFGPSEWSARLPTLFSVLLTVAGLFLFCKKRLGDAKAGLVAGLILVCSPGFMLPHLGRSADLDALLTFLLTTQFLVFLSEVIFTQNRAKKASFSNRTLSILMFLIVAAFLTKGAPGFFFLPFFAIVALFFGRFRSLFFDSKTWFYGIATLAVCASYYVLCEWMSSGYFEKLRASEWSRFDAKSIPWHVHPPDFYFKWLFQEHFRPFIFWLAMPAFWLFFEENKAVRRSILAALTVSVGYLGFISMAAIKLTWYEGPLFPLFSLAIGLSVSAVWRRFFSKKMDRRTELFLFAALILTLFGKPYLTILEQNRFKKEALNEWEIEGGFIQNLEKTGQLPRRFWAIKDVFHPSEHYDQLRFYQKMLAHRGVSEMKIGGSGAELSVGDTILVCQKKALDSLEKRFVLREIEPFLSCKKALLVLKKDGTSGQNQAANQ